MTTTVTVNPDEHHILSANAENVLLLGSIDYQGRCVVVCPRATYHAAIDAWLDHKAAYSERYDGAFCGVGEIQFDDAVKLPKADYWLSKHLIDPAAVDGYRQVKVKAYQALTFTVCMEHG